MAIKEKVGRDQSLDNLIMEDSMKGSDGLSMEDKLAADNTSAANDSSSCRDEVVVKVGRKRAYDHETEDPNSSLSENNKDLSKTKQKIAASDKERSTMESDSKASSSSHQESNWLESARAEMGQVREENERLKKYLSKMIKDYEALQMQFYEIMQQEETKKSTITEENREEIEAPDQLVSLSLGRIFSSEPRRDGRNINKTSSHLRGKEEKEEKANNRDLSLALECKFEASESDATEPNRSPVNSFGEPKEDAAGETWPSRDLKPMQNGEDEVVQQNPLKKARVCVRARCDTPTMTDGCQWRKYGQKIAKGNPCPRAYYRCTVAPNCPVRKQVQRCAEDMSILITTYEGTHNHSLPLSATAMASTTSAAASMLLSGSSSSTSRTAGLINPSAVISTTPADLHGLNFYLSDNSSSKQLYFHSSNLSPSPSHPTITLDLTNSNPSSSLFNRYSSSSYPSIPKFAPSTLNFSSSTTESNSIPNWGNGYFGYGNTTSSQLYSRSQLGTLNIGRPVPPIENNLFQSIMQNKKTPVIPRQDTIAAATKAITADPSFQSVLAAALTSIIGNNGGGGDNSAQTLKWGEHFPVASGYSPPTPKGNACATSYLNKTTLSPQSGSLMLLPTSLPFSSQKSNASPSPGDNKDHTG